MQLSPSTAFFALAALIGTVVGQESHNVALLNLCGFGTPILLDNGELAATGNDFQSNAPINAIIYLQVGDYCGPDGGRCTVVETTLSNLGSMAKIKVSPPYAFNVPVAFSYHDTIDGLDGLGTRCDSENCAGQGVTVEESSINTTLWITFCPF